MCRAMEEMRAEAAREAAEIATRIAEQKARKEIEAAEKKAQDAKNDGKILGTIEYLFDEGKPFDEAVAVIVRKFKLSPEKATELVANQYD